MQSNRRRAARQTKLRFENLETRALLAGNMKAFVDMGTLYIIGDSKANQVQIYQSGNKWKVQGLGTTINGSNSIKTVSNVQSIHIESRGGNDFTRVFNGTLPGELECLESTLDARPKGDDIVQISNIRATAITASVEDGNDNVLVEKTQATSLLISTSISSDDRNDVVTVLSTKIAEATDINTGGGSDAIAVNGLTTGSLSILGLDFTPTPSTRDDNDSVSLVNVRSAEFVEVDTGAGADTVIISNLTSQDLRIALGSGNDVASLSQVTLRGELSLAGDSGTDAVTLSRVTAADSIDIQLGSGNNDRLTVVQCATEDARFDGGNNSGDTLVLSLNTFADLDFDGFQYVVGAQNYLGIGNLGDFQIAFFPAFSKNSVPPW